MDERVEHILEQIPGWSGKDLVVAPLLGGITNQNYRVDVAGETFVLRVGGKGTRLLGIDRGYLQGRKEIRPLFDILAIRKPPVRQYFRTGYLTGGKRLIWEYPRDGGKGEQMDFVEAMDLNDEGLIQRHCVYWGWFGFRVLQRDEYHR